MVIKNPPKNAQNKHNLRNSWVRCYENSEYLRSRLHGAGQPLLRSYCRAFCSSLALFNYLFLLENRVNLTYLKIAYKLADEKTGNELSCDMELISRRREGLVESVKIRNQNLSTKPITYVTVLSLARSNFILSVMWDMNFVLTSGDNFVVENLNKQHLPN